MCMCRIVSLVLLLFVLISCNTNAEESEAPTNTLTQDTADTKVIDTSTVLPQIGCFYEMDDKYSDEENSALIELWWMTKLDTIEANGVQNDVLQTNGGGPNGAEWNTDTDLYFVVFPVPHNVVSTAVSLNDVDSLSVKTHYDTLENGVIIYFSIEKEIWQQALRPIEEVDYLPLYGKEKMENEANFIAPLNIGEVFKINVTLTGSDQTSHTVSDYFHIAYGE